MSSDNNEENQWYVLSQYLLEKLQNVNRVDSAPPYKTI